MASRDRSPTLEDMIKVSTWRCHQGKDKEPQSCPSQI